MKYTMTFTHDCYEELVDHLFNGKAVEQAAYILCGLANLNGEKRFLVKKIIKVSSSTLLCQERDRISIPSDSYVPVIKEAAVDGLSMFYVHSHQLDIDNFSDVDNENNKKVIQSTYNRVPSAIHGDIVFASRDKLSARVWINTQTELINEPLTTIRIIGKNYSFIKPLNYCEKVTIYPEGIFDRQVKAFGSEMQTLLRNLHIGVVGCGGTGSAVVEQLIRLGVGELTVIDHDKVDESNITRIHGSTFASIGQYKTELMKSMADEIGLGTRINVVSSKLTNKSAALALRGCELVFGCTDDHAGRAILNSLSYYYLIPVIDMAFKIDSKDMVLRSLHGRVTHVGPGHKCLFCRGWIDPKIIAMELSPSDEVEKRAKEGYAPELEESQPAVLTFTTAVAAQAVIEMLNLFMGFIDKDRDIGDILIRFDATKTNLKGRSKGNLGCICDENEKWGRGDCEHFLGMNWPEEMR